MGVGHSGLLTRYDAIRFVRTVACFDLSKSSFRVGIFPNAVKRTNPVAEKVPADVVLIPWVKDNFVDVNSMPDSQLWSDLANRFLRLLKNSRN